MNKFYGTIHSIQSSTHLSRIEIDINSFSMSVFIIDDFEHYKINQSVQLMFKESAITLSSLSYPSTSNSFAGTIEAIDTGDLLSSIAIQTDGVTIKALIGTREWKDLNFYIGQSICWSVLPSSIVISGEMHE